MNEHGERCWRTIGAWGDASCPTLAAAGHCRRCATYAAGGRALFARPMPEGYREEWTRVLAAVKVPPPARVLRVLVFQVWTERLALPMTAFHEAVKTGAVRTIPLLSSPVLRGIVNIRGDLLPCLSVGDMLGIEAPDDEGRTAADVRRFPWMLVVGAGLERFAFPVNEILGVVPVAADQLQIPPATLTRFPDAVVQQVFCAEGRTVGLLAEDRFLNALHRSLAR